MHEFDALRSRVEDTAARLAAAQSNRRDRNSSLLDTVARLEGKFAAQEQELAYYRERIRPLETANAQLSALMSRLLDMVDGGLGDDTLTGGPDGPDWFVFSLHDNDSPAGIDGNDGDDIVTDFNRTTDVLRFTDVVDSTGGDALADLQAQTTVTDGGAGGNVTVEFDNGASIVFEGMGTAGHTITDISQLVDSAAAQIQVSG